MAPRTSAGLLIYRRNPSGCEVLLGHYGGPFWARRDRGAWTVFKGGPHQDETVLETATREFEEETGWKAPSDPWQPLPQVKAANQIMNIWAVEADFDPPHFPRGCSQWSGRPAPGKTRQFPEIDRAEWFSISEARAKMPSSQRVLLNHLTCLLQ